MHVASRRCISMELIVAALAFTPGLSWPQDAQPSGDCPTSTSTFRVGHTIETLDVSGALDPTTGTVGETRQIQVELWYPARDHDDCDGSADLEQGPGGCHAPLAVYRSRIYGLYGDALSPLQWSPMSWTILAASAFENARVAGGDERFPVVIFSHGNQSDAIDYAYTLESLASHGYVVAAPDHLNNTQDEVRIDVANAALGAAHQPLIPCLDGAPPDVVKAGDVTKVLCSRPNVAKSMVDRYHDVQAVLDALPTWFGPRVDMDRVGIMGHSRGTVTSLSVAGGSSAWGQQENVEFLPDPRIKAVMGLSIGTQSVTSPVDVQNVTVPVLLMNGTLDATGPLAVSQWTIAHLTKLAPEDKQLVVIQNAYHRHFDSAYCAELQSSGAIAQAGAGAAQLAPTLDLQTATQILVHPSSGLAVNYCALDTFTTPTDIRPLVQSVMAKSIPGFTFSPNVPTSGLTTDTVKDEVVRAAVSFFGGVLDRADRDHRPLADCLPDELRNQPPVPEPTQRALDEAELHADDPD